MITENSLKTISTMVAVFGFVFGIIKFIQVQEIAAAKPYLEKKLEWCEEAVKTASSIANDSDVPAADEKRFWELYWGVMGLVEKQDITNAMIAFGKELETSRNLKEKSLNIAHACRSELANDWSSSWSRN